MIDSLTRVVTIAVARPVSCDWKNLDERLAALWAESTSLANWALLELLKAETPRTPDDKKLGKWPGAYLYGAFKDYEKRGYWTGAAASANCILRAVEKRWKTDRFAVMFRRCQAPPSFRYPQPYRVHNKDWSITIQDGIPLLNVSLPGGRVELLLRRGSEYRRQLGQAREIASGEAKAGELMLTRHPRTGQVMVRMVAHFPKRDPQPATGSMLLRSDPNAFLVAEADGMTPRLWNCDHIKAVVLTHKIWLQRVSEDTKREKRVPRPMRRHIDQAREDRCRKFRDRINSFNHEVSAQVANLARRQKVATVILDTDTAPFVPEYDWSGFKEKLRYKLDEHGITLIGKEEASCPDPEKGESKNGPSKKSPGKKLS